MLNSLLVGLKRAKGKEEKFLKFLWEFKEQYSYATLDQSVDFALLRMDEETENIPNYMDCHHCGMVTDMHSRCEYCGADSAYKKEVD